MQNMDKNSKTKITNGLGILKRFRLDACIAFESLTVEIRSKDIILVFCINGFLTILLFYQGG